jgi:hypothetical protein
MNALPRAESTSLRKQRSDFMQGLGDLSLDTGHARTLAIITHDFSSNKIISNIIIGLNLTIAVRNLACPKNMLADNSISVVSSANLCLREQPD